MKLKTIRSAGVLAWGVLLYFGSLSSLTAQEEPLYLLTTTEDLADLARQVGREKVQVEALIPGDADPHYMDARPDFILKASRARILCRVGLDLEAGWLPQVLRQSRNSRIMAGGTGDCDAGRGVRILEKPPAGADRSMGDFHAYGNPHYWLDPVNAAIAARNILDALIRTDPVHEKEYRANYDRLHRRLKELTLRELKRMQPYRGRAVAVHHREFVYLAHRFGFRIAVSLEEKPGVPPSAAYLQKVVKTMKREKIGVILLSPYAPRSYADRVAERTGARVVVLPISVNVRGGIDSYEKSLSLTLRRLREAFDAAAGAAEGVGRTESESRKRGGAS